MKRIFYLSVILPFFLLACERTPEAHFSVDKIEPEVGQDVFFTNESNNAVEFEWDFGDGFISSDANPVHVFTGTGSFEVILTVYSGSGLSDKASITIDVKIPTLLEIEVVEYYDEYFVPGASVRLYPTLPDWEGEKNMTSEGYTDSAGFVVFSHLGPYIHYVDVWEKDHNNYALKDEDVQFIRTPEIMPHRINRFTAWVDYTGTRKGTRSLDRNAVIKKLERKAENKVNPSGGSGTDDWKELYDRSIKMK
jgi:PKD repeat protein